MRPTALLVKIKARLISAFVLFHILAITCWCVPLNSPLIDVFRTAIRSYMLWSGLFQSWDMFAPLPRSVNAYIEGVVITKDGRIHTWKFPRMELLGLRERYSEERYRKFEENVPEEKNSALWPDVARHLARFYNNAENPPEIVMLIRYWSDIVPEAGKSPANEPARAHIFFECRLKPEDLR